MLSPGGKATLINHVLSSIPVYTLGVCITSKEGDEKHWEVAR